MLSFLSHVEDALCGRIPVLVINHCIGLHGRLRSGERDMYDETHGIIAQLPTDE